MKRTFPSEPLSELRYKLLGESVHHANITYTLHEPPACISTTRWGIVDRMVFEAEEGRFYEAIYEFGATEMQDHDDLTDNDCHDCWEVTPQQVTVTKYVKANP